MLLRKTAVALVVFSLVVLLALRSLNPDPNLIEFSGATMGTHYSIKLSADDSFHLKQYKSAVDDLLFRFERQMSTYQKHSELMQFNHYPVGKWFPATEGLIELIEESIQISQLTRGAFDVTVGPVVRLWGFGPDHTDNAVPSEAEINTRMSQIGFQYIDMDISNKALKKQKQLEVDLSAIAKGKAVDEVAHLLDSMNVTNYLVEIGGEVRTKGRRSTKRGWQIGIEAPLIGERAVQAVVSLQQDAMASSGDYRNFFEADGVRYSHTIDPRTGYPVRHNLAAVTVIRDSTSEADALATALMVLGPEEGYDLALRESIAAYFIIKVGSGFEMKMTPQFEPYLTQVPTTP